MIEAYLWACLILLLRAALFIWTFWPMKKAPYRGLNHQALPAIRFAAGLSERPSSIAATPQHQPHPPRARHQ